MVGQLVDAENCSTTDHTSASDGAPIKSKGDRIQSPSETKTPTRSIAPFIYVRNFHTQTRRVENMRHLTPNYSTPKYSSLFVGSAPPYSARAIMSNGGRLVTKRQGCAEVVQIVGKVAPLSIIPDLKQSAPESVDENCSELLSPPPPPHCACSDRSCSADTDSDEQQQQQQLRNVSDRLASSEDQAAQLLGDTQQLLYQLELLKDELQEEQEQRRSLQRLHQTLDQQHDQLQKFSKQLQVQLDSCQDQLNERQTLLKKHGLVMVGGATGEMARGEAAALISQTSASLLQSAGNGSLESRIRRLASERNMLEGRIVALKNDLENSRTENAQRASETLDQELLQRRAEKLKQEYSEKLKKSEQELNTLHATMLRLETQAHRQRMHAQQIESNEDELRAEKRKLKKQLRESQSRIEELESCNSHLNKRMDKLNTVLKELTSPPPQQA